jgi:ABC-type phosphate transport system substrate-binding protein
MRKRSLLLVVGACLATLSLAVSSAFADPVPAGPRQLAGVGSDTSQDVMNGFGNGATNSVPPFAGIKDGSGNLIVASYDATGSATITTHNTPVCTNIPRPAGSGNGVTALHNSDVAGNGCIQFARSSADDSQSRPGQNLTYVPFALDGITYATASTTNIPKTLTLAQLTSVYSKNAPCGTVQPLLPHAGSGTRSTWLKFLGLSEATLGNCVKDVDGTGVAIEEHDGRVLVNPNQLVPYGVAQWITQTTQPTVFDRHGRSVLRAVNGVAPMELSSDLPTTRKMFNVIRNADVGAAPFNTTFVGPGSAICSHSEVLKAFGFKPISDCGSTTTTTP